MGSGLLQMGTRPRLDGRGPHLRSHASGWEQPVGKLLEGLSGLLQPDTGFIRSISRMGSGLLRTGWALASSYCVFWVGSGLPQNWVGAGLILLHVLSGLWPPPELGGLWPPPELRGLWLPPELGGLWPHHTTEQVTSPSAEEPAVRLSLRMLELELYVIRL